MALRNRIETGRVTRPSGPFRIWLLGHASTCVGALARLMRQPFANFMTILVIGVTLALPAAMHLIVKNAASVSGHWENALDFSVYLKTEVSLVDAERLTDIIRQRADVEVVTVIPAAWRLEQF